MTALDKKIIDHLPLLNVQEKRSILAVMKAFVEQQEPYDHWKDPAFVKEMDRRLAEIESGQAKLYSWEEVKARIQTKRKRTKK